MCRRKNIFGLAIDAPVHLPRRIPLCGDCEQMREPNDRHLRRPNIHARVPEQLCFFSAHESITIEIYLSK